MASGSLPPGFPATEIDGEHYWDGGIVSNTPLQWVLDSRPRQDTLAFQVDLWSARGEVPRNMGEADVRQKEIRTPAARAPAPISSSKMQKLRGAVANLLEKLPAELRRSPRRQLLAARPTTRSTTSFS